MDEWLKIVAGFGVLVLGTVNAVLMFEVLGRRNPSPALKLWHRRLGLLFVAVYCGLFVFMLPRAAFLGKLSTYTVFHAVVGMATLPVVIGKYLVARRYKAYAASMPVLGFLVLVGTFVVIMLSSGHSVLEALYGG
jgi:hypothetical protein